MTERLWLPALLFDMRERFDEATALRFARHYGGRRLYVPARALEGHFIAQTFSLELLVWLVDRHGGNEITVPMATASHDKQRLAEIVHWVQSGADVATLVSKFGIHERTVKRLRARYRVADPAQSQFDF